MQMELRHTRAFLRVAESNPTDDQRVIEIVEDVKKVAYDAEDESWDLFKKIVSPARDEDDEKVCTAELKDLILKSCCGLSLAIVLIGGLLSTRKKLPIAWNDAVKGMISWEEVQQGGQVFSKVLGLSYRDHLKPCFLYLSHFPEDFDIKADKLIRLWVAEGFVPDQVDSQSINHRTMEDIAEGWLEDLVSRCLVQAVERDHCGCGMLETCRMYDVLRDLSITESEKANFSQTWRQQAAAVCPLPATIWRLVCKREEGRSYSFGDEFLLPKLRSSLCIGLVSPLQSTLQSKLIMSSKLLLSAGPRELQLQRATEGDWGLNPSQILRYLSLRRCSLSAEYPIFQNLQTLDAWQSIHLKEVSDGLWKIRMLGHAHVH